MFSNTSRLALTAFVSVLMATSLSATPELPEIKSPDCKDHVSVSVRRVIDGDTIVVVSEGRRITVRLIGVDAPESGRPYGQEATVFLTNLLKGERVYLLTDPRQGEQDRYGRLLAYVFRVPDRLFVNAELIRQGYARAYGLYHFKYLEQFRQLAEFAQSANKGLWSAAAAVLIVPSRTRATTPKPDDSDTVVYITRTGQKYHCGGCGYLRKSSIPIKLKDARASGYTPCSRCRP